MTFHLSGRILEARSHGEMVIAVAARRGEERTVFVGIMDQSEPYPGSPGHQKLLRAVVSSYAEDPRIRALGLYGSLARGNWDEFSDIDLAAVTTEGAQVDPIVEVRKLCDALAAIGERTLTLEPLQEDGATAILASLTTFSVTYGPLAQAKTMLLDGFKLLLGDVGHETIVANASANYVAEELDKTGEADFAAGLQRYVRLALRADVALQRRQLWTALGVLQHMRDLVLLAFAQTQTEPEHGDLRPFRIFQRKADPALQALMGTLLPRYSLRSAQKALAGMLNLAEHGIADLTRGRLQLSAPQRELIALVRRRQAVLHYDD